MNYHILSKKNAAREADARAEAVFFTTDRTIGRDPELIFFALGMPEKNAVDDFVRPHQTHTDRIYHVTRNFFSLSKDEQVIEMDGIDAVVSDVGEVCLGVSTADCIPVLVYDPVHHAAAAIHAGWRGTVKRIVEKAIKKMVDVFGSNPADCEAVVGPGISQQSFEVGWEVHQQFLDAGFAMDKVTIQLPVVGGEDGERKPHIDLKEINRQQLIASGVKPEKIMVSDVDTFTDLRFFSARREQHGEEKCGRIFSGFIIQN